MSTIKNWREVEEVSWEPISSLGSQWMVKSTASDRGYAVMLTDGCGLWGERRSAKYVLDQADEWASCIEAGITELSTLVLSEMRKTARVDWEDSRKNVKFCISSKLNDMSYSWEFQLMRLGDELFNHHWTTPLLVQFHHLGTRLKQLTSEVESKNRQLEELLPDTKKSKNSTKTSSKNKAAPLESSAEVVLTSGVSSVMQEQMLQYPQIMQSLHRIRNPDSKNEVLPNQTANNNTKRPVEVKTEEELEEEELRKQQERRAQIQELSQGTRTQAAPQKKKKKKLNI